MVGLENNMKRYSIILIAIFALVVGYVSAQPPVKARIVGLEDNAEYMALLTDEHIDAALLPIGDVYTMGPVDALRAVKMIQPKLVIPMHYNTMPPIVQDADAFSAAVQAAGFAAKVLNPGDTTVL